MIDVRAAVSESAEQGVVVRWYCRIGDRVRRGDCLGEIETEKVNLEIEAPEDGRVAAIVVAAGATFAPNAVLLRLEPGTFAGPGDLANRLRERASPSPTQHPSVERRCAFCDALRVAGNVTCVRCGAPY